MARQSLTTKNLTNDLVVKTGVSVNDKTGDPLREAFNKIVESINRAEDNFVELYNTNADNSAPAQLQAVPTTREGQAGDKAGMMAIDTMTNYVYICKTDYTSGAEIIWLRIQGDTAW